MIQLNGLNSIESLKPGQGSKVHGSSQKQEANEFKEILNQQSAAELKRDPALPNSSPLTFSNHAVDRMRSRGIQYSAEKLNQIQRAVDRAAGKGARETLVLADDSAMIVSVDNRKVVTVMDRAALKENVFTNIDSTVVI